MDHFYWFASIWIHTNLNPECILPCNHVTTYEAKLYYIVYQSFWKMFLSMLFILMDLVRSFVIWSIWLRWRKINSDLLLSILFLSGIQCITIWTYDIFIKYLNENRLNENHTVGSGRRCSSQLLLPITLVVNAVVFAVPDRSLMCDFVNRI